MSEEETNEVELLKKWIGFKDTGLYYVTFRIEEVEILLNLISKLEKENTELKEEYEELKEKLHEKNMRIIELNKLLGDKV